MGINEESSDWRLIKSWAQCELESLTQTLIYNNDDVIRGRIQQLQDLLNLPAEMNEIPASVARIDID